LLSSQKKEKRKPADVEFGLFILVVEAVEMEMKYIGILSVCKLNGNDKVSLLILESVDCDISSESLSSNVCECFLSGMANISEKNFECCALSFDSYSTDELGNLSKQILRSLLSSQSLAIEDEDSH
jgi:hypothetical protein